jgi:hypothetical protein
LTDLEQDNAALRADLEAQADLATVRADSEHLAAAACRHPAEAMDRTTGHDLRTRDGIGRQQRRLPRGGHFTLNVDGTPTVSFDRPTLTCG